MSPITIAPIVKTLFGLAAQFGTGKIVSGFAMHFSPTVTTVDKVLRFAATTAVSGVIGPTIHEGAVRQLESAVDMVNKATEKIQENQA